MHKLFSINEFNQKIKEQEEATADKSAIRVAKFMDMHTQKLENLKALTGRLPTEKEMFFLWTLKSFNAFTFIVYVIKHCGIINDLSLSTYSINDRILTSLVKWYDKGSIQNVNINISDSIKHRNPKIYDQLQSQIQNRSINVDYTWNHSKITLMRSNDNHFVVEGSGNFSENAQHEQYLFANDKQLYDFRHSCIKNSPLTA